MSRGRPTVAILGLGLLGGSLGLALAGRMTRAGWDPDPAARRGARRRGAVDRVARDIEDAAANADLVVLAAPPRANLLLLTSVARATPRATVTDVGSVKAEIARRGRRLLGARFVPGHPMAGDEGRGITAARADLFLGTTWVLCGGGDAHRRRVASLARAVGASPLVTTAARHDRLVAAVSHLPQLIVSLAVGETGRRRPEALRLAGRAYREWGRLAASSPELWEEIAAANGANLRAELAHLERALRDFRSAWGEDPRALRQLLERGRRAAGRIAAPSSRRP